MTIEIIEEISDLINEVVDEFSKSGKYDYGIPTKYVYKEVLKRYNKNHE